MSRDSKGKIINGCSVLEKHKIITFKSGTRVNWICVCSCGNFFTSYNLSQSNLSCGCKHSPKIGRVTHGLSKTPTYRIWKGLFSRCYNPKTQYYHLYGGLGVTVCDRWKEPDGKGFLNFLEDMGERPEGLSLNRVNGAMVYSKESCEWATASLQAFDQRQKSTNTSGKTGVSWSKVSCKWKAQIMIEKKVTCLGSFTNYEDAVECRKNAELKYYGFTKN